MLRIFADYESFYDRDYSLRKMSPIEYVLDPRWETLACAVAIDREQPFLLPQDEVARFLTDIKQPYALISHNMLFDGVVTAYRYGIHPPALMCTLSLARATIYHELPNGRLALKSVAQHLKIGVKSEFIQQMAGVHWADLVADPGKMMLFSAYAINDVELCREIFFRLRSLLPSMEAIVMDRVIRMATQPMLRVNMRGLDAYREQLRQKREILLSRVMLTDPGILSSNIKFAGLLAMFGVEPPMKLSPSDPEQRKMTYAFAKTDTAFTDLLEHDDPMVQALVAARLGVKSTIEETRSVRFINIGLACDAHLGRPYMPVPLKYSGAHTHRYCLTGDTKLIILRDGTMQEIRLDTLQPNDLVWDSDVFVQHGGLSYAGMKEVMTYEEVTGTFDHNVWTVERGYLGLAEAAARGYHIARGNVPDPTRIETVMFGADSVPRQSAVYLPELRQGDAEPMGRLAYPQGNTMQGVSQAGVTGDMEQRGLEPCPPSSNSGAASLSEPVKEWIRELWEAGYSVSIRLRPRNGRVGADKLRTEASRHVDRSDRQRWPLRTGQYAMGDTPTAEHQQAVWDIINCGSRNQFMANGRIVHNSGDWKLNMQNLSARKSKEIRRCLYAPDGYTIVAVDASQIEARIVAWLAGQDDLLEMYVNGEDTYKAFASEIFSLPLYSVGKVHRFVGKTCILGLGFGMSARKLLFSIRTLSREQGIDLGFELTLQHCENWVMTYRRKFFYIQRLWNDLNGMINLMAQGLADGVEVGPCKVEGTTVILPSGLRLFYDNLRYETDTSGRGGYVYDQAQFTKRIYGGKLTENLVQALDRQHVVEAGLRTEMRARAMGIPDPRVLLNIHDENVHCVPKECADALAGVALEEMARNVSWSSGLPLAAEVKVGPNLGSLEDWRPS